MIDKFKYFYIGFFMQKFEKKYLNKQGYLDLRTLCPNNVNYLINKTNNRVLGVQSIESRGLQSSDLSNWSDFSSEEKAEMVKIILTNEKQFYQNQASKTWKCPDLMRMTFVVTMLSAQLIAMPAIGSIVALTASLPLIANLLVGTILLSLAIFGPTTLLAGLIIGCSYLLYKCNERNYKKELVTIDQLEKELSSYQANTMDQSIKSSTDVNVLTEEMSPNVANDQTITQNIVKNLNLVGNNLLGYRGTLFNQSPRQLETIHENTILSFTK